MSSTAGEVRGGKAGRGGRYACRSGKGGKGGIDNVLVTSWRLARPNPAAQGAGLRKKGEGVFLERYGEARGFCGEGNEGKSRTSTPDLYEPARGGGGSDRARRKSEERLAERKKASVH